MAAKINGVESEWARGPPVSGPLWERMAKTIYNPEDHSILGRTPKRWGIVFTFYMVFYAVLAAMFAACMGGLFYSIDPLKPTHILDKSLIGVNPGVAHRPRPEDGSVLSYDKENTTYYDYYVQSLEDFLQPYKKAKRYADQTECGADTSYGFPESPCFFIKLNKIYGWKPEFYDVADLPEDMPEDLVEHIKSAAEPEQVWVSCWDEHSNETRIEYPWSMGLPGAYYPFLNNKGQLSPLVAVQITPPVNMTVTIRCRVWAKNVIYNKSLKEPSGYTRFQLHVEGQTTTTEPETTSEATE